MGLDFFGLDPSEKSIWFGILALMVVEIGLVTPPLGMNLFIVQRAAGNVPLTETAKGVIPFITSDILRIILLALFPAISLCLLSL
ncbi:Sialic acid TRAP transporter permease protein SiaT [compost metagenome]